MLLLLLVFSILLTPAVAYNQSFAGLSDIVFSPNYPDNYDNNLANYYLIQVPDGNYAHLTMLDFHTENYFDVLYIYDGDNTGAPIIANLSGNATGFTLDSTSSSVLLFFYTDLTGTDKGFAIRYDAVVLGQKFENTNQCPTTLHNNNLGFITSPNWPSLYPNNISCNYLITGTKSTVMLTFVAFITEACCDYVDIYDGPNMSYNRIIRLSGNSTAGTFYSTQPSLFINFSSDLSNNFMGFSAVYKAM